jgi:glycosyltransferase involved in cell wall biosynthesis
VRVLFFHAEREWSGQARVFASAGRVLAQRGYQVTYACPAESVVERRVADEGVEPVPMDVGGAWLAQAYRLKQILEDYFVEVVCVHTEHEHLVASTAARLAGRGAVVRRTSAGGHLVTDRASRSAMRLAATGFLFTTSGELQTAVLPTKRALEPVVADVGVDVARYDQVRMAARQSLGVPGDSGRVMVCVYDPTARARAATVMRTVAMLAPRHPELRLVMVGRGADHEDLRMHAAALGVTGVVKLLGERDDHLSIIRAADIGWIAADCDDAAYGALDCMALRVPVLAERGTVAERYVADGITGILLPPGDVAAVAATAASFLAHHEDRLAMGNAGHVRVARDFTETRMADGFEHAVSAARDRTRWIV